MSSEKRIQAIFSITPEVKKRVESFINSPVSPVKSLKGFYETAVVDYLEREEPILRELEKARAKIRKELS